MSGVDFSYIIPFHNSKRTLRRTLASIMRNEHILEVILVDDCSSDGSIDTVKDILGEHRNVVYFHNEKVQGAGISRNIGAHRAKGSILVFVDSDIVVPPHASIMLQQYFFKQKVTPVPDAVVASREKEGLSRDFVSLYKNHWTSYNFSKLDGWTSFLNTSLLAIRKDALVAVGGFLDIGSGEDSELGFRLFRAGYKTYFSRELSVYHDKKYTLLSLLKREFRSGKDSIKIKFRNRMFQDLVTERKFFAVNSNFIYSLPLAVMLISLFIIFIFSRQYLLLPILVFLFGWIVVLNAEFFSYASPTRVIPRVCYFFLLVIQLNVLAWSILVGIVDLVREWILDGCLSFGRHTKTFIRLFFKRMFPPERVTIFLTERCNLRCGHCFLERKEGDIPREMDLKEYESTARGMKGVNHLILTGGEPFLRDDIVDIVRILARYAQPSAITILTNGFLTDAVVESVKRILSFYKKPLLIKVSMDSFGEMHDSMRGKDGAFRQAYSTFLQLKGLKRHHKNLGLGIITTYTRHNSDSIEPFYDDVVTFLMPDQFSLVLERPREASELNNSINIDDYARLLKKVSTRSFVAARGFFCKLRVAYKIRMADITREIYLRREYPMDCWAGTLDAVITPAGDVLCCEQLKGRMGNLREAGYDFRKLWYSMQAGRVRRQVKGGCFCTNECYMPFNLVFSLNEIWGVLWIFLGLYIRSICPREMGFRRAGDSGRE